MFISVICPDPIIAHGSAIGGPSGAYTPGQTTSIICQRGYRMVSHDGRYSPYGGRIVCREDGLWLTETGSTFLPRCECKGIRLTQFILIDPLASQACT